MKRITVRDIRQRWPEAERLLQAEHELLITRDGIPIARLTQVTASATKRPRFDPAQHRAWQTTVFGPRKTVRWVDRTLERNRTDRQLGETP
jgi:antitoxin (DNA-binding transcriptional repressor) of toxin-antitoxin stability system